MKKKQLEMDLRMSLATISGYHPDSHATQILITTANKCVTELLSKKDNWISVDDRLPEDETVMYVYTYDHCHGLAYYTGCDDWIDYKDDDLFTGITHWQPLPEAPKGVN